MKGKGNFIYQLMTLLKVPDLIHANNTLSRLLTHLIMLYLNASHKNKIHLLYQIHVALKLHYSHPDSSKETYNEGH